MERDDDKLAERRAKNAGPGWHSFSKNLYLRVDHGTDGVTRRRWICRVTRQGRKRDFGLGGLNDTSVKLARKRRDEKLAQLRDGLDPVAEKRAKRDAAASARAATHTFRDAAEAVMKNREGAWKKGSSSFASWMKYLFHDAKPLLKLPVGEITVDQVKAVVEPHWRAGHMTAARRILTCIELTLGFAIAHGWRLTANVASWEVFKHIAPAKPNGGKKHHQMVPWRDMPAFIAKLRQSENSLSAVALELIALTACRSNEVRGMRFDEIDWDEKLWVVPKERMKRSVEFKVPLSKQALALLKALDDTKGKAPLIFPGPRAGKSIANQALWTQMGRATGKTATTHGLRASFKSWGEDVGVDHQVAERCLAHAKGDATVAAYNRGDMIERRRAVMQRWADFLDGKECAKVVAIGSRRRR
jgi:integrase